MMHLIHILHIITMLSLYGFYITRKLDVKIGLTHKYIKVLL